jgi:hypothetical protein
MDFAAVNPKFFKIRSNALYAGAIFLREIDVKSRFGIPGNASFSVEIPLDIVGFLLQGLNFGVSQERFGELDNVKWAFSTFAIDPSCSSQISHPLGDHLHVGAIFLGEPIGIPTLCGISECPKQIRFRDHSQFWRSRRVVSEGSCLR